MLYIYLIIIGLFTVFKSPIHGQEISSVPPIEVSLISLDSSSTEKRLTLGVLFYIQPGWYMHGTTTDNTVDFPTTIKWMLPEGLHVTDTEWPAPELIDVNGYKIKGHQGKVLVKFQVACDKPSIYQNERMLNIEAQIECLACSEQMCVPVQAHKKLSLPLYNQGNYQLNAFKNSISNQANVDSIFTPTFLNMLLFSIVGGFLLNLMPCVFPIIALKIMGFINQAMSVSLKIKLQGIGFTFGVLCACWSLGTILIILKLLGAQIGWGFQLQSPFCVISLALLFFFIALNFLGIIKWNVRIPFLNTKILKNNDYVHAFFSGLLTVLVATPCTAPFMGTALGFSFTQPPVGIWLIFTGLGLGISLPYLIICWFPKLLSFLPKPGKWMQYVQKLLAIPLLLTVIWLLWVLGQQQSKQPSDMLTFSPERVLYYREKGYAVLVKCTAAWCLTCHYNDAVLTSDTVQKAFQNQKIIILIADWTNRDATITRFLQSFNRIGIPFSIIYPSQLDQKPFILPTLLTPEAIFKGLEQISGSSSNKLLNSPN